AGTPAAPALHGGRRDDGTPPRRDRRPAATGAGGGAALRESPAPRHARGANGRLGLGNRDGPRSVVRRAGSPPRAPEGRVRRSVRNVPRPRPSGRSRPGGAGDLESRRDGLALRVRVPSPRGWRRGALVGRSRARDPRTAAQGG